MSEEQVETDAPKKKGGFKAVLIALVLALVSGGGVGYAVYAKLIPIDALLKPSKKEAAVEHHEDDRNYVYVEIPKIILSLGKGRQVRHLSATLHLETEPAHVPILEVAMPRVQDAIGTYLRAVDESDLEDPAALVRLRALLLHRIRLVVGRENVSDLLISEFIVN